MKIKIIYVGLVSAILIEMTCIILFVYGFSITFLASLMIGLQVIICMIVGVSATIMHHSLRSTKNLIHHLDQKIAMKSAELAMLSHDIRSPVSGITQMSRLIYNRLEDPELKRLQKLIIDSSEQLSRRLEIDAKNDIRC